MSTIVGSYGDMVGRTISYAEITAGVVVVRLEFTDGTGCHIGTDFRDATQEVSIKKVPHGFVLG